MQKGYFASAWDDIVNSPGWFSQFLKLALLCFIPIFGAIVIFGYLYGWARDMAWNVHRPMSKRVFGNEDGNLYIRGFYILVICFVCSLVPGVFSFFSNFATGFSFAINTSVLAIGSGLFFGSITMLFYFCLSFFVQLFIYVGSMRASIYSTLSSGFQIGKIWSMIRYDFSGLLKIFAMNLIVSLLVSAIMGIVIGAFVVLEIALVVVFQGSNIVALAIILGIILFLLAAFIFFFVWVFQEALVSRALGYWTRQFEVSSWRGQEDPMPFEKQLLSSQY